MILSQEQIDELHAIAEVTKQTDKPAFQYRCNWSFYEPLVAAGLIAMGPHPDFSDEFKAITLTRAGLKVVGATKRRQI